MKRGSMIKISILSGLIAILSGCATVDVAPPSHVTEKGHKAEFKAGDCTGVDPKSPKYKRSDKTPVRILYVDRKYDIYVIYIDHPRFLGPVWRGALIEPYDEDFRRIDCPES